MGSRHEDFDTQQIRLSLERTVEVGGRRILRSPVFELSRAFVEDLPNSIKYRNALESFLRSLSFRIRHPKPHQFLTHSGVPIEIEIRWPFRQVQDAPDSFVHVFVTMGSPWLREARFSILIFDRDRTRIGPSLTAPVAECVVINEIRRTIAEGMATFYAVGRHPAGLQQLRIELPMVDHAGPSDAEVQQFIKRKVYWLGFREGDDKAGISISDPYDCSYLGRSARSVKEIALVLGAQSFLSLDPSGEYACVTDSLLAQSAELEKDLAGTIQQIVENPDDAPRTPETDGQTVFISYNVDDAPFATALAKHLRSRRIRPWIDKEEIRVGDSLIGRIGEALHDNDFIIAVLSPSSVRSEWVRRELNEALTREIRERRVVVLPVIARKCKLPAFLTDKSYADFTKNYDVSLDALVRAIQQTGSRVQF